MNISFSWLKKYVDFDLSADEVGKILTSIGLEVSGIELQDSVKGGLRGLVIGKVLTCEAHQNSDHLHVTTVDVGGASPLHIVCGAPNIAAGQTVVVATIGTTLYNGDESYTIKKGKIRGEVSEGMICSAQEIGLSNDHSGILVIEEEVKPGTPAAEYFGVTSDYVIEVDITPNRVDATSHYGVARDLYAYLITHGFKSALHLPEVGELGFPDDEPVELVVESSEACPRYMGVVVKGMKVGESPKWLKTALETIGQRPINNVVDIANYILFELGQPLHTFDLSKVEGGIVKVRLAKDGELLTTLDGSEIKLTAKDLVIADSDKPLCLAGVMGGLNSGVTEETRDMFLEVATFHPTYIRKSARRFGFNTDASFRYERGLDPNQLPFAFDRALTLFTEITGGQVSSKVYDVYPTIQKPYEVSLSLNKVAGLTGLDIPESKILEILKALDIEVVGKRDEVLELRVPRYRYDVTRDIDVIEDILRIYGYNEYPEDPHLSSTISVKSSTDMSVDMQMRISEQLTGAGFNEILNNSLSKASYYQDEIASGRAVQVMNPLSNDLSTMRMTMMYGGLEAINHNINRQAHGLRLYEFGNCYRKTAPGEKSVLPGYHEDYRLAVWMTGDSQQVHWQRKEYSATVFELKAVMLNIFRRMGLNVNELSFDSDVTVKDLEVSQTIRLKGGAEVARWGIVSHELLAEMDIDAPVYFAELEWTPIMEHILKKEIKAKAIAKYPMVKRDFALLIDKHVSFADIESVAKKAGGQLLKSVVLFDVYEDSNHLPEGKKSYAVAFGLQDAEKTLSDKLIDKTMNKIYEALNNKLGATLR